MSTSQCKMTMTALRERSLFLASQVRSTTLFMLQLLSKVLSQQSDSETPLSGMSPSALRRLVVTVRRDEHVYNRFYNSVVAQFPNLSPLIRLWVDTTLQLIKLRQLAKTTSGEVVAEPIRSLWLYYLQLVFLRPDIVTNENALGSHVKFCQDEVQSHFVPNIVKLDLTPKLSLSRADEEVEVEVETEPSADVQSSEIKSESGRDRVQATPQRTFPLPEPPAAAAPAPAAPPPQRGMPPPGRVVTRGGPSGGVVDPSKYRNDFSQYLARIQATGAKSGKAWPPP